ncbi:MAG: HK97 family phage prohead protease [Burkholderiales bacterium]|nr:HK97 family phage prohead protease [Opitutaceae bacterium]
MTTPERRFNSGTVALRDAGTAGSTGRTVRGYAAVFNKRSENLGTPSAPWVEVIAPGAFDGVLKGDVRALFNHDSNLILARSKNGAGTLKLWVDATGLGYEFEAPDTQAGRDLLVSLKRGDISQSSFGFTVATGGDEWRDEGKTRVRTIRKIGSLLDVSPVAYPAYPDATAAARAAGQAGAPADGFKLNPADAALAARFGIF